MQRWQLDALLVEKNKVFTEALKSKRPHSELVLIFDEIKSLYKEISKRKTVNMSRTQGSV